MNGLYQNGILVIFLFTDRTYNLSKMFRLTRSVHMAIAKKLLVQYENPFLFLFEVGCSFLDKYRF